MIIAVRICEYGSAVFSIVSKEKRALIGEILFYNPIIVVEAVTEVCDPIKIGYFNKVMVIIVYKYKTITVCVGKSNEVTVVIVFVAN